MHPSFRFSFPRLAGAPWFRRFLLWRFRHISTRHFVWFLAVVVGIIAGLAVVTLKGLVWGVHYLLEYSVNETWRSYLFFLFPSIGIALAYAFQRWAVKGRLPHGTVDLMYRVQYKKSFVPVQNTYAHMVGSGLTVGFGGSLGLEASIVATGGAWGANLATLFRLGVRNRTLLLACGAAAAAAAIFNAPIAGVLFTLEVLMIALPPLGLVPLLMASVTAVLTARLFFGDVILFNFSHVDVVRYADLPYYLAMGVVAGLGAVHFTRTIRMAENKLAWMSRARQRILIGGIILGALILAFPPLYGEGYHAIKHVLGIHRMPSIFGFWTPYLEGASWMLVLFWLTTALLRPLAAGITLGAGGTGGIFAPTLFIGSLLGYAFAMTLDLLGIGSGTAPANNLALVGMAGTLSALLNAPLTAIFLIAEITRGYQLLLPLILTSAIAYGVYSLLERRSLYGYIFEDHLKEKGITATSPEHRILSSIRLDPLIEKDFVPVPIDGYLADLVEAVKKSHRHTFPVLDEHQHLHGVVDLDDIREFMFDPSRWRAIRVSDVMHLPPAAIKKGVPLHEVMQAFDKTRAWILPVVDAEGHYLGFISRARFFNVYRRRIQKLGS